MKTLVPQEMLAGEYLFKRFGATVADYKRAADEDSRLELVDGVMIMHSPASVGHERLFAFLLKRLSAHASAHQLGEVFGSRTPMNLDDERRFEPDLLFVKREHLDRLGDVALEGPADLVIEILSPATRDYDVGEKRAAYAAGGVPEYWIVDPLERRVLIDRPAGMRVADLQTGALETPALPGLTLKVEWFWQSPLPDAEKC